MRKSVFEMLCMFVLGVLMMPIVSCDKDTGGDGGAPSNQPNNEKKLVRVMEYDGSGEELEAKYEFKYNQAGNVVEYTEGYFDDGKWQKETVKVSWSSNESITLTSEGEEETLVVALSDGRITSWGSWYNFTYDEKGFVKTFVCESQLESYSIAYTWDDSYLFSIDCHGDYARAESVHYGNKACKGFLPVFGKYVDIPEIGLFMAMPELVGVKTTNLPTKINGNFSTTFDYQLDAAGYVVKCIVKDDSVEPRQTLYEFVWE